MSNNLKFGHGRPEKCFQASWTLDFPKAVASKSLRSLRHRLGNLLFKWALSNLPMPKMPADTMEAAQKLLELLCKARKTVKFSLWKIRSATSQKANRKNYNQQVLFHNILDVPNNVAHVKKREGAESWYACCINILQRKLKTCSVNIVLRTLHAARSLPFGDWSAFSQSWNMWPLSPLVLSPKTATMTVSALNTLICLVPPHLVRGCHLETLNALSIPHMQVASWRRMNES